MCGIHAQINLTLSRLVLKQIIESPEETVDVIVLHPDSTGNSSIIIVHAETLCRQQTHIFNLWCP